MNALLRGQLEDLSKENSQSKTVILQKCVRGRWEEDFSVQTSGSERDITCNATGGAGDSMAGEYFQSRVIILE